MDEELKKIEKLKEIPNDVLKKIDGIAYYNLLRATAIMAICVIFLLGYRYVEPIKYIIVLRVFSIVGLAGALFMIERAYKKDSGKLAICAVEMIVMALGILSLPYLYMYDIYNCPRVAVIMAFLFGAYYGIKGIVTIFLERKKYRNKNNDLKDITK